MWINRDKKIVAFFGIVMPHSIQLLISLLLVLLENVIAIESIRQQLYPSHTYNMSSVIVLSLHAAYKKICMSTWRTVTVFSEREGNGAACMARMPAQPG